jgi:hypothetical protein
VRNLAVSCPHHKNERAVKNREHGQAWLCYLVARGHDGFFVRSGSGIEGSQAVSGAGPSQGKQASVGSEVAADVSLATGASLGVISSSSEAVGSVMPAWLSASMAGRVRSWRLLMKARTAARRGDMYPAARSL